VGFRAPAHAEIITGLASFLSQRCRPDERFRDREPVAPLSPGEIRPDIGITLKNIVMNAMQDDDFITWFGEHMTRPRYPDLLLDDDDHTGLAAHLRHQRTLYKAPGARFAFTRRADHLRVFADGHSMDCPVSLFPLIEVLSDHRHDRITAPVDNGDGQAILSLETLYNQGSLLKEPPYDDADTD